MSEISNSISHTHDTMSQLEPLKGTIFYWMTVIAFDAMVLVKHGVELLYLSKARVHSAHRFNWNASQNCEITRFDFYLYSLTNIYLDTLTTLIYFPLFNAYKILYSICQSVHFTYDFKWTMNVGRFHWVSGGVFACTIRI